MTEESIKRLYQLRQQKEKIETEISKIQQQLVLEMKDQNTEEVSVGPFTVYFHKKETIKFTNEDKALSWLEKNGYSRYVTKSLKTKTLNAMLKGKSKTSEVLNEALSTYYDLGIVEYVQVTLNDKVSTKLEPKAEDPDFIKYFNLKK